MKIKENGLDFKFINITIDPGRHIEIRNPGKFRNEQVLRIDAEIPIRRIIPIPKAQNPRLADVLKSFDRWEGKGLCILTS